MRYVYDEMEAIQNAYALPGGGIAFNAYDGTWEPWDGDPPVNGHSFRFQLSHALVTTYDDAQNRQLHSAFTDAEEVVVGVLDDGTLWAYDGDDSMVLHDIENGAEMPADVPNGFYEEASQSIMIRSIPGGLLLSSKSVSIPSNDPNEPLRLHFYAWEGRKLVDMWAFTCEEPMLQNLIIRSAAIAGEGLVIAGTEPYDNGLQSVIFCIDTQGKLQWTYECRSVEDRAGKMMATPDGGVIVTFNNMPGGPLIRLSRSGELVWKKAFFHMWHEAELVVDDWNMARTDHIAPLGDGFVAGGRHRSGGEEQDIRWLMYFDAEGVAQGYMLLPVYRRAMQAFGIAHHPDSGTYAYGTTNDTPSGEHAVFYLKLTPKMFAPMDTYETMEQIRARQSTS